MENEYHIEIMKDLAGYFKGNERDRIYNEATKLRDKVLIRLLWKSGRRVSEVLKIKRKDINFESNMILWNIIKKKIPYKAWKPIDTKTMQLLAYYLQETKLLSEHYLIHGGYPEKHITRQRVYDIVRQLSEKAGIDLVGDKKPHPHHFRHSAAIDLSEKLKSPADVRKLQKFLEHSSLAVTETYLQFSDEELRTLIEDD